MGPLAGFLGCFFLTGSLPGSFIFWKAGHVKVIYIDLVGQVAGNLRVTLCSLNIRGGFFYEAFFSWAQRLTEACYLWESGIS